MRREIKMKNPLKYFEMKILDLMLIVIFVIISFFPAIYFARADYKAEKSAKYLEIQIDGKLSKKIKLTGNTEKKTIRIERNGDLNVVEIDGETVRMIEANCHDLLCTKVKPISKSGETIVCLPHKVVLQITGENNSDEDINAF